MGNKSSNNSFLPRTSHFAPRTFCTALFFSMLILAVLVAPAAFADGPADCANIQTDKGKITGALEEKKGLCSYRGVPFAAPPVGELRFAPPREHEPWTGALAADAFGSQCLQFPMVSLVPSNEITGSEDCLYLNIWQPLSAAKAPKPVMIFVHGGGFVYGSGSFDLYDGSRLAYFGDTLVVTINYRLGPFGFLAHPALRENGGSGNWGILDQIAALNWVNRNIAAFGGDPGNVTVFGESAGGMSVGLLLMSPLAKGLLHKAIIESGPALMMNSDMKSAEEMGLRGAAKLGCGDSASAAGCLRSADVKAIMLNLRGAMMLSDELDGFSFMPVIDGGLFPDKPVNIISGGTYSKVPVMLGTNRDEMSYLSLSKKVETPEQFFETIKKDSATIKRIFGIDLYSEKLLSLYPPEKYETPKKAYNDLVGDVAFACPTRVLANMLARDGRDVYLYHFAKAPTDKGMFKDWGAFHGSELAFVFGKFEFLGMKFKSEENSALSKKMIGLWSSFARDGAPAAEGVTAWPRYTPEKEPLLNLDTEITVIEKMKSEPCGIFETIVLNSAGG